MEVMKTYKYIQNNFFFSSRLTGEHHNDFKNNTEKKYWLYMYQSINILYSIFIEFLGYTRHSITLINALDLTSHQILKN